jgi:hypothetical protein
MGMMESLQKILKVSAPYTSSPLNYICNKSIRSGTFATPLKYPNVKPLYKEGEGENMDNYRPISLFFFFFCNPVLFEICTSTFSKLCTEMYKMACRRVLTAPLCNEQVQGLLWLSVIRLTN